MSLTRLNCRKGTAYLLTLFFTFGLLAAETVPTVKRGLVIKDCTCQYGIFDEPEIPTTFKKGQYVSQVCEQSDKEIICRVPNEPGSLSCPNGCIKLVPQLPLTREESHKEVTSYVFKTAKPYYQKRLSLPVLSGLEKKYPQWLPAIYNSSAPHMAHYKLINGAFEIPLKIDHKFQAVSVVFFYQNLDQFLKQELTWSFWMTSTGELLFDSLAPFKPYENGYVHDPCPAPAGKNLDEVVLYGFSTGAMDSTGCCGPYALHELKTKGPVKVESSDTSLNFEVMHTHCSKSVDENTGKYSPLLYSVDGPANIRKIDHDSKKLPKNSEVIGTCADKSRIATMGTKDDWVHVFCEGLSGWTHKKNIRSMK